MNRNKPLLLMGICLLLALIYILFAMILGGMKGNIQPFHPFASLRVIGALRSPPLLSTRAVRFVSVEPEAYPDDWYEPPDGLTADNWDSGDVSKIDSIDYSLRIIAGGVVLVLCGFFIWITVLKPIKYFVDF